MIEPQNVKKVLSRHLLTEGFDMILDLEKSRGSWFVDQRNGERYLDFFSRYASMALGYNHPKLLAKSDILGRMAVQKPSNSDVYTEAMAEFVDTFSRVGIPEYLPHAFFIEGGALAVENALKTAFDWKVRKNLSKGHKREIGSKVIPGWLSLDPGNMTGRVASLPSRGDIETTIDERLIVAYYSR